MTANNIGNTAVIHPAVVVKIAGYKFRALLDSGASHSYASSTAINLINAHPKSTGLRQIAGITTRTMQVFGLFIYWFGLFIYENDASYLFIYLFIFSNTIFTILLFLIIFLYFYILFLVRQNIITRSHS